MGWTGKKSRCSYETVPSRRLLSMHDTVPTPPAVVSCTAEPLQYAAVRGNHVSAIGATLASALKSFWQILHPNPAPPICCHQLWRIHTHTRQPLLTFAPACSLLCDKASQQWNLANTKAQTSMSHQGSCAWFTKITPVQFQHSGIMRAFLWEFSLSVINV